MNRFQHENLFPSYDIPNGKMSPQRREKALTTRVNGPKNARKRKLKAIKAQEK